jgi:hypothetical protein
MGTLNLLQGSFTGKVGAIVGTRHKSTHIAKAAVFSKAPPTPLQDAALDAFICLNRLSSIIAKKCWDYLGLQATDIHKHNAVARHLKISISNNKWQPELIKYTIPNDKISAIGQTVIDSTNSIATTSITPHSSYTVSAGEKYFLVLLNQMAQPQAFSFGDFAEKQFSFPIKYSSDFSYSVLSFIMSPNRKSFYLHGFNYTTSVIIRSNTNWNSTNEYYKINSVIWKKTYTFSFKCKLYRMFLYVPCNVEKDKLLGADVAVNSTSDAVYLLSDVLDDGSIPVKFISSQEDKTLVELNLPPYEEGENITVYVTLSAVM